MALGLPNITIIFKGLASSAIERSERGIVACILKDDTEGGQRLSTYESVIDIDFEHWTEANYGFLKLIFAGGPVRVIALRENGFCQPVVRSEGADVPALELPVLSGYFRRGQDHAGGQDQGDAG